MTLPAEPRRRRLREDQQRNHDRLLEAALELFDTHGLDVPLRQVGERANISPASLFRHFANRDQLIVEVYDRAARVLSDRALAALIDSRGCPPAERLDRLLDTIVAAVIDHPSYGQLAARGSHLHPRRETDPAVLAELAALIDDAQDAGELADDVTGYELINAGVLVGGMRSSPAVPALLGDRMMTIVRRGLAPHAQHVASMTAIPGMAKSGRVDPHASAESALPGRPRTVYTSEA